MQALPVRRRRTIPPSVPACTASLAANPHVRRRYRTGHDKRVQRHSCPQACYEDAIGLLLSKVGGVDDVTMTEAMRLYGEAPGRTDEVTLARIEREREEASQRLAKTQDIAPWQATMATPGHRG